MDVKFIEPTVTPGPWTAHQMSRSSNFEKAPRYRLFGPDVQRVATITADNENDVKLMAAAVVMHAALHEVARWLSDNVEDDDILRVVRAALDKADERIR